MGRNGQSTVGGQKNGFSTTHWSRLRACRDRDEAQRRLVLDQLSGRYWRPVYWYCRRKGYAHDAAQDLVQGFFQEIVLGRDLFARAEPAKGRFRTFLLTALDRYLVDVHRRDTAGKRYAGQALRSLDQEEIPDLPADQRGASPEQVFCYAWATDLLDEVLHCLHEECHQEGHDLHWRVFETKVLQPLWESGTGVTAAELCRELGLENEFQVSNMLVTVKRKFRRILEQQVRQQVESDADFANELGEILEILSHPGARNG